MFFSILRFSILIVMSVAFIIGEAAPQPDGKFWRTTFPGSTPEEFHTTAEEACFADWNFHSSNQGDEINFFTVFNSGSSLAMRCQRDRDPENDPGGLFFGTQGFSELVCPAGMVPSRGTVSCVEDESMADKINCAGCNNASHRSRVADGATQSDNPINFVTGTKVERALDFATADGRLQLRRTYTSHPATETSSGWGWFHNFDRYGDVREGAQAELVLGNGSVVRFGWDGTNFTDDSHHNFRYAMLSEEVAELTYPNGAVETHAVFRRRFGGGLGGESVLPTKMAYPDGYEQKFIYAWGIDCALVTAECAAPTDGTTNIKFVRLNGTEITFNTSGSGTYQQAGATLTLADPVTTLQYSDGTIYRFVFRRDRTRTARAYFLREVELPTGEVASFPFNRPPLIEIEDSYSRNLIFEYDSAGRLSAVLRPDGYRTRYEYQTVADTWTSQTPIEWTSSYTASDTSDVLTRVIYPDETPSNDLDNEFMTYHYEDSNRATFLTGITDERGIRVKTTTYVGQRATSSVGADGRAGTGTVELLSSGSGVRTIRHTTPLGKVYDRTFTEDSERGYRAVSLDAIGTADTVGTVTDLTRTDGLGFTSFTDEQGNLTDWDLDAARGLTTRTSYLSGQAEQLDISTVWHPTLALPERVQTPDALYSYTYSATGNLLTASVTDLVGTPDQGTSGSAANAIIDPAKTRTVSYTYSADGLLLEIDGPLTGFNDKIRFTYTADGYVSSVTNETNHTTQIPFHNGRGQPLQIIDPNGLVTDLSYNPRGWLTEVTVNPGTSERRTSFTHDAAGNITRIDLPNGGHYAYEYDNNGWLDRVTHSRGDYIELAYDNVGNVTSRKFFSFTGSETFSSSYEFDALSRMIRSINGVGSVTNYGFDTKDRVTQVTDPVNEVWGTTFDGLDRVLTSVDPETDTMGYSYETDGDLAAFDDSRGLQTTYEYNGFGEVVKEISPDRGEIQYFYDEGGRLRRRWEVGSGGTHFFFTYDAASRIKTRSIAGAPHLNQTFTYDEAAGGAGAEGRMTSMTDGWGTTTYQYNIFGEMIGETKTIESQTYTTSYSYTSLGLIESMTLPSGRVLTYNYDNIGRLLEIEGTLSGGGTVSLAENIRWAPFGGLTEYRSMNGLLTRKTLDKAYRLSWLRVIGSGGNKPVEKRFTYDAANRMTGITDFASPSRNASFTYTPDGRLATATGVWGDRRYTYDAVGNRMSDTLLSGTTILEATDYVYPGDSNRLSGLNDTSGNPLRSMLYNGAGDVISDDRGVDDFDYIYDGQGRLSEVRENGVTVASYGYDAYERRVWRDTSGVRVHYVFDQAGRPMAEHDAATGALIREYYWIGDMLVAQSDGASDYAVHGGYHGQPILMTNAAGSVVWDAAYEPFGTALPTVNSADNELRYPGQWAEAETGLVHNWHRDYDPSLGRYLEADPLGLAAGQSLYGYAMGSPLEYVDPDGRLGFLGAFFGGATDLGLQLAFNDGRLECVDWWQVGASAGLGFLGGFGASLSFAKLTGALRHAKSGRGWFELSSKWSNASRRIRRAQGLDSRTDLHHAFISQNGRFGRHVPDYIKNHPLNLKPLPRGTHRRIHGRDHSLPGNLGRRFGRARRYLHGTPNWSKAGDLVGTGIGAGYGNVSN